MSQITWMAKRLQELELLVSDSRSVIESAETPAPKLAPSPVSPESTSNSVEAQGPAPELPDLNVDANGRYIYYGSTSALEHPFSEVDADHTSEYEKSEARTNLVTSALHSRRMEEISMGNAALRVDIPRELVDQLLNTHWTWIHPVFMFIYRPAFMRDMGSGGKYFSQLLLSVMCCHSTRFTKKELAAQLLMRVHLLLGEQIQDNISIPTVQALLQLSARQVGQGAVSQGWLYSGIAFRMAIDLGLFNKTDPTTCSAEDREIRKRLAWSCFCWDKAMSLYLGRMPALREPPMVDLTLLDDFAEHELWQPYYGADGDTLKNYPETPCYTVSCFISLCRLSVIINDIILGLYSGRKPENVGTLVRNMRHQLELWWVTLPAHLRIETSNLPAILPPPHIISLNIFYHTSIILLHRPFRSAPDCRTNCRQASQAVESIVVGYGNTFGFNRIPYLMSYCIYTAATIVMEDLKDGFSGDRERIEMFLEALECAKVSCPGIQQSIDIIRRNLSPTMPTSNPVMIPNYIQAHPVMDPSIPTFPFLPMEGMAAGDYGMLSSNQPYFATFTNSFQE
jgi:hypothetical protein